MRTLTVHEKRTVRFAAMFIGAYLVLFFGWKAWSLLETKRSEYQQLVATARDLKLELQPYADKVAVAKKLMEDFQMDPAGFSRASVVADASSAIQTAAAGGGMKVGPIREAPARTAARELASIQFECSGPVPAAMALLSRLERLGYPLIVDSVQITTAQQPGQIKLNLTIVVLDFEQWKKEDAPRA